MGSYDPEHTHFVVIFIHWLELVVLMQHTEFEALALPTPDMVQ